MDTLIERLQQLVSWDGLATALVDRILPNLIAALVTAAVYAVAWRVARGVLRGVLRRSSIEPTARELLERILRAVVVVLGGLAVLKQFQIDTSGLLASMGIVGITLGFAARDTVSNIISGIFLLWDRPFVVGDLVEVEGLYGEIRAITLRSTRLVTVDGKMVAIPNAKIANSTVASYTNSPHLRLDVKVTVGVGEDLGRARRLLLALVDGDARFLNAPAPAVVVTALNDYNVELELRTWLADERQHVGARVELRERAFEALRGAGVVMPYETLVIQREAA